MDIVMAVSLQQRLEGCLSAVGYGGKVGRLSPEVTGNEKLNSFMEWVVREALQPSNHLSTTELDRCVGRDLGHLLPQLYQHALTCTHIIRTYMCIWLVHACVHLHAHATLHTHTHTVLACTCNFTHTHTHTHTVLTCTCNFTHTHTHTQY